MPEFFFKVEACNFIEKETVAQMFSCELYTFFKNTLFVEHFQWLLPKKAALKVSRRYTKLQRYYVTD